MHQVPFVSVHGFTLLNFPATNIRVTKAASVSEHIELIPESRS